MNRRYYQILVVLMVFLVSCTSNAVLETTQTEIPTATNTPTPEPTDVVLTLEEMADIVVQALADKDLEAVAEFVHPEKGVRFSPYGYVMDEHQVFMPEVLPMLKDLDAVFTWGSYDGTGDPIELTFKDYYEEFIYSADFINAEEVAVNERVEQGNTINNIDEFFPGSSFVEYHFSGFDEQYGGMDWESLRLVFIEDNGQWFLVGIIHDQWTI